MKRILYTILAVLTAAVCLRPLNAENGWSLKTLDGETVTADAEGMTLLVLGDQKGMVLLKTEIFQNVIDQAMEGLSK